MTTPCAPAETAEDGLKGCPFCDGKASPYNWDSTWVVCETCGAYGPSAPTQADGNRLWNTRTDASELAVAQAEIARLREDCAEFYQVIGCLAESAGLFDTEAVNKALDNADAAAGSEPRPHSDLLPFAAESPLRAQIAALQAVNEALREALTKSVSAMRPLIRGVFNDNGDISVSYTSVTYEESVSAYFAERKARAALALSATGEGS